MDYTKTIYVLTAKDKLEEYTLAAFLREFCSDETTSPRGVEPRLHIRERDGKFDVWTWGPAGNFPRKLDTFDTEEEAERDIMHAWYTAWCNGNAGCNVATFDSVEEYSASISEQP